MDDRKRTYRHAISAGVGFVSIISFTLAMGELGFGKPKEMPVRAFEVKHTFSNQIGREVSALSQSELRDYLSGKGFDLPANISLHKMRRVLLASWYKPLFDSTSAKTGVLADVLFAFFIIEATREGVESPMFLATWNAGGVKYRAFEYSDGSREPFYSYDDCAENGRPVMCAFENPGSFENSVALWAAVFNSERYLSCKDLSIEETCKCLQQKGYHTAKNYRQRARIAKAYRTYLNMSPDARR